jgi:hypothetical protein
MKYLKGKIYLNIRDIKNMKKRKEMKETNKIINGFSIN